MPRSVLALLALAGLVGLVLELTNEQARLSAPPACALDQLNRRHGTLRPFGATGDAVRARYDGSGANGYARGILEVRWRDGADVAYGAEFFLPRGFSERLGGQVDLMRWDNFRSHPRDSDWGGISLFGSDGRARLVRFRAAGGGVEELVGPFDLPEGRWFRLDVRQRLSAGGDASSVVALDGDEIGESGRPSAYGRTIERVRFGIVAIAEGEQTQPLEVRFRGAGAATPPEGGCVTSGRTPRER